VRRLVFNECRPSLAVFIRVKAGKAFEMLIKHRSRPVSTILLKRVQTVIYLFMDVPEVSRNTTKAAKNRQGCTGLHRNRFFQRVF